MASQNRHLNSAQQKARIDRGEEGDKVTRSRSLAESPYNIEKARHDDYPIVMAVAGFTDAELNVTQKEGELVISGKAQPSSAETEYLYRGAAGRDFERRFQWPTT